MVMSSIDWITMNIRSHRSACAAVGAAMIMGAGSLGASSVASGTPRPQADPDAAFQAAAARYDVPRDVLVSLGYTLSRLDDHAGKASQDNGYGVMHLAKNPDVDNLGTAARLTHSSERDLRTVPATNIAGAAALLRAEADRLGLDAGDRDVIGRWYEPVANYSGYADKSVSRSEADATFAQLGKGLSVRTYAGRISVAKRAVTAERGAYAKVPTLEQRIETRDAAAKSADYPPAAWVPAASSNYRVANRGPNDVNLVVIHTMQGSYAGSISWFQNPASEVSAHYLIRSSDGAVTQMVSDKDVAYHAGSANSRSLGIEHEGYVDDPAWYTDTMYRSSADVTRHITSKFDIARDRAHIQGHSEVPGATHTDPGSNWNWGVYMSYVTA